jgi:LPXTG-site transpeptidase (sortase) family protein
MPNRHSRPTFSWWQTLLLLGGVITIFVIWQSLNTPGNLSSDLAVRTTTFAGGLTIGDVLPTLTPDTSVPLRQLIFPAANIVAPIVEAVRAGDSWEVRYLGQSVGHLAGTSWLDGLGGNIVLAGHVEDAEGKPGPFANLSQAKTGDTLILRDGQREIVYRVVTIAHAAPDEMQYVAQNGRHLLTLITCSDWDSKAATYHSRLVVIATQL